MLMIVVVVRMQSAHEQLEDHQRGSELDMVDVPGVHQRLFVSKQLRCDMRGKEGVGDMSAIRLVRNLITVAVNE